jgi:hypothetical protein
MDRLAGSVIAFIMLHYSVFGTRFLDPADGTVAYFTEFGWDGESAVSKSIFFHTDRVMDKPLWDELRRYIRSTVSDVGFLERDGGFGINFIRIGTTSPFALIVSSNDADGHGFTLTLSTIVDEN